MRLFDHEKLKVYQDSIRFVAWVDELPRTVAKPVSVYNQLERASTSVPLNIAEGKGKHTSADRCRFFDAPRGSALECAACLDVPVAKGKIETGVAEKGKDALVEIVSMLIGLIRANSQHRDVWMASE